MFNHGPRNHFLKLFVCLLSIGIFFASGQIFAAIPTEAGMGIDLGIANYLTTYLAKREQNDYLKKSYDSSFAGDPFRAAVEDAEGQDTEIILGGIQEIITQLQRNSCSLTQREISSILYYFDADFRARMGYKLSQATNQVSSTTLNKSTMEKACMAYNRCYYAPGSFGGDIMTDCKDTFLSRYRNGSTKKDRLQSVKTIQLGKDKYRNTSLDDSPYDLMYDMTAVAKILFEDIKEPYQVLFYHLPNFKGTAETSSTPSSDSQNSSSGGTTSSTGTTTSGGSGGTSAGGTREGGTSSNDASDEDAALAGDDEFSSFLEGQHDGSASSQSTLFGGNICMTALEDPSPSQPSLPTGDTPQSAEEVSDEEYQEYIDDLLEALESYEEDPEDFPITTGGNVLTSGSFLTSSESGAYEAAVKAVQTCIKSCDGLRIDQKAACMAKCACGQWDSPLFDPYKTPGLGPIMKVKFCTVPVSAKDFSQKGIVVYSIEGVFNQLLGVLDTLDKSGELGVNVKQKEFMDSSAKKINFGKMITFSVDQSVKKSSPTKTSAYATQQYLKTENTNLKQSLNIANNLNDPVSRNAYVLVEDVVALQSANTYASQVDSATEISKQQAVQHEASPLSDAKNILQNERYINLGAEMYDFLQQQQIFWVDIATVLEEMRLTVLRWSEQ